VVIPAVFAEFLITTPAMTSILRINE
jgi:hypothetical protein